MTGYRNTLRWERCVMNGEYHEFPRDEIAPTSVHQASADCPCGPFQYPSTHGPEVWVWRHRPLVLICKVPDRLPMLLR